MTPNTNEQELYAPPHGQGLPTAFFCHLLMAISGASFRRILLAAGLQSSAVAREESLGQDSCNQSGFHWSGWDESKPARNKQAINSYGKRNFRKMQHGQSDCCRLD